MWLAAHDRFARVDALCEGAQVPRRSDLADHRHHAALPVCNNIAEKLELGTTQQPLLQLSIAGGSAGKVRSTLRQVERIGRFSDFISEGSNLRPRFESCSCQRRAFAGLLRNGDVHGQKYLIEQAREDAERRGCREAFEIGRAKAVDHAWCRREPASGAGPESGGV